MKLSAQLRRVEKAAGIGQRCLDCRRHYILFSDEIKLTPPADLYVTSCGTCDQALKLIHSGFTERERTVLIAVSGNTFSDSKKWLASYAWVHHLPRYLEVEKIGEAEERRLRGLLHSGNATLKASARKQVAVLDEYEANKRAQAAKMAKVKEREQSRLQKSAEEKGYDVVIAALDRVREKRREIGDTDLFHYYVMAEMEVFMWGEKSKETLKLIEDRKKFLADEKARQQAEEEERQRKREEERQLREEERKRQHEEYLARQRGETSSSVATSTDSEEDNAMETLKSLMPPNIYEAYKADQEAANKEPLTGNLKFSSSPFERKEAEPQPPPDDRTMLYQRRLAHFKRTGVWLPEDRCPADWYY
jgi:hypothetical protein